jgi:hypothetical protein
VTAESSLERGQQLAELEARARGLDEVLADGGRFYGYRLGIGGLVPLPLTNLWLAKSEGVNG